MRIELFPRSLVSVVVEATGRLVCWRSWRCLLLDGGHAMVKRAGISGDKIMGCISSANMSVRIGTLENDASLLRVVTAWRFLAH